MGECCVALIVFLSVTAAAAATPLFHGAGQQLLPSASASIKFPRLTSASVEVNVVGGEEVTHGEVPYLVSLQDTRWTPTQPRHFCGGAIYDASTIVTTAHCVSHYLRNYFGVVVVAGEHQRSVVEGSEQVMQVQDIILHPQYDAVTFENNIAVIKLTQQLNFNEYVQPIGLPPAGAVLEGQCLVAGWGPQKEGGQDADVPHKATVPVWPHDDCVDILSGFFYVADHMICAGYEEGGVGACESDSGSPLTCYADGAPYLGGTVSWQFGCSRPFRPTVYSNMVHFALWLKEQSATETYKNDSNNHERNC